MKLFTQNTCDTLPNVAPALTDKIKTAPRTADAHRDLMRQLAALHLIETDWKHTNAVLPAQMTIASWNLERCLDPENSAHLLQAYHPDIVLLSEMDYGMARTQQHHTTAELARRMGMGYAYCVEFHELGLGSGPELEQVTDDHNHSGWHGNAILCKTPPKQVFQIRLDDHGHWFCTSDFTDPDQPRVGGRVAVGAIFPTEGGDICAISTHLESAGNTAIRQSQMDRIIAAIDVVAPDMPVIIGADMNTGNNLVSADWRDETLFAAATRQGYSFDNNAKGTTTRPSRLTRFPDRAMKLDWFCTRGCTGKQSRIIPALDKQGLPLSDHELLIAKFHPNTPSNQR